MKTKGLLTTLSLKKKNKDLNNVLPTGEKPTNVTKKILLVHTRLKIHIFLFFFP